MKKILFWIVNLEQISFFSCAVSHSTSMERNKGTDCYDVSKANKYIVILIFQLLSPLYQEKQ